MCARISVANLTILPLLTTNGPGNTVATAGYNDRQHDRMDSTMISIDQLAAKTEAFRAMHNGPEMLVMPNAWDAASAQHIEAAGFPAIATTSGGVAASLGYADHEAAPVEEMLTASARIARAVSVPVTVDFEAGYQLPPTEIARRLIDAGVVGMNLEESDHHGALGLTPPEVQAELIAAVKSAARDYGIDLVLNARIDVFIRSEGTLASQLEDCLRRARIYHEAGADCIYPIGLSDPGAIQALVEAVEVVNVTVRRGGPLSLATAAECGARRVTYATSVFREVMAALDTIAADIHATLPVAAN